ncbi:MAG: serine/threonine-protein kinase [Gemmatimonadaceae bacterium]
MSRDAAHWARVEHVLDLALDAEPAMYEAIARRECAGDHALLREVLELLEASRCSGAFLEDSAASRIGRSIAQAPAPSALPVAGDRLGPWRLLSELGHGGMGTVFLAERADGAYQQQVAIKLLHRGREGDEFFQRFLVEREILARLHHAHIARLVDGGATADGRPWFALEHVANGLPITTYADRQRLTIAQRIALVDQVCDAIDYAHRHLVVHRDLKPSNVLVGEDGQVKLLDFGIAKLLEPFPGGADPTTGLWVLTPDYAAPEQVSGGSVTTATDVYSLGLVVYELLSGQRAQRIDRLTPADVTRVVCEYQPPLPSAVCAEPPVAAARGVDVPVLTRELSGDLDTIVMKAIHKDPARRYGSVGALQLDLRRHRAGLPVLARGDSRWYRTTRFVRRHMVSIGASVAVVLALLVATVVSVRQARRAEVAAIKANTIRDFLVGLFGSSNPEASLGQEITAAELVRRGVGRIDSTLGGQPAIQQELLGVLVATYRELGRYAEAESLARRAIVLAERADGPTSLSVASRLTDLSTALAGLGKDEDADRAARRALEISQNRLSSRDPALATALVEAAVSASNLGATARAESLYRQAIGIDVAAYGPRHAQVATDFGNLGVLYLNAGRLNEADSALMPALDIRRERLDSLHPALLTTLGNVAALRKAQGRYAEAETFSREVLRKRIRVLGPDHPDVAYSYNSVASGLEDQGRLVEAESLYRESLRIRRQALGAEHQTTLISMNNLAILYSRIGNLDSAIAAERAVVTGWRKQIGVDHPNTATAENNLGLMLTEAGEFGEAERLLQHALRIRKEVRGDSSGEYAATLRNVALLRLRSGRAREAEAYARTALAIHLGPAASTPLRVAEAQLTLGEALTALGRAADADTLLTRSLAARQQGLQAGDARIAEAQRALGIALGKLRRLAVAESLLTASHATYASQPSFSWQARRSALALADVLAAQGKAAAAAKYRKP